jgi:SAM-dependent methyltransferase
LSIPSSAKECIICGGRLTAAISDIIPAGEDVGYTILDCEECGLGVLDPQPDDLDRHYEDYYGGRHGFTRDYRANRRLHRLERSAPEGGGRKVLDIGFGDGSFLRAAKRRGWITVGTERNARLDDNDGIAVFADVDAVRAEFGGGAFDAVTCWHTLEHFRDPAALLGQIHGLLADDGVLLIAVPDYNGRQSRIFGRYWLHLDVPRHLYHFGPEPIRRLLTEHGFRIGGMSHHEFEYDVMGWAQSLLNRMFSAQDVFFRTLAGRPTDAGAGSRVVNFVLGALFSAVSLPMVLIDAVGGRGGTLVVRATKMNANGGRSA